MCSCSLGPKAAYYVGELAQLSGLSRHTIKRILVKHEVPVIPNGRGVIVPLSGIRTMVPLLWDSIVEARTSFG